MRKPEKEECKATRPPNIELHLSRPLRVARDDLDLLRGDARCVPTLLLKLECDVLNQERPHLVAEAVCIEAPLIASRQPPPSSLAPRERRREHLERQVRLNLIRQHFGDVTIKVAKDLHCELRRDAALRDQVIECICERHSDAAVR